MNPYNNISKDDLVERAKELECLYLIEEALNCDSIIESLKKISAILPKGFRNTECCSVVISFDNQLIQPQNLIPESDKLSALIIVNNKERGQITVMYPKHTFNEGDVVFLEHEVRLLNTIAKRIADSIEKRDSFQTYNYKNRWEAILTLLQKTDHDILRYVCEKMNSLLASMNPLIVEAIHREMNWNTYHFDTEINSPLETLPEVDIISFSKILFKYSMSTLTDTQIYEYLNLWIYQGKTYELIKIVDKPDSDIKKISAALSSYIKAIKNNEMSSEPTNRWLKVELTRRFITENPNVISRIHKHLPVEAFLKLLDSFISSPKSIGRIGGKGSGFFMANQIFLRKNSPIFLKKTILMN